MSFPLPARELIDFAQQKCGTPGLIVAVLVIVVLFFWWKWDAISTRPFVASIIQYLSPQKIPKADPARFSVILARLEDDSHDKYRKLIGLALSDFKGIEVLLLDRAITLKGSNPEVIERKGHEKALEYLTQSGAEVLIWGTVIEDGTLPKLLLSHAAGKAPQARDYGAFVQENPQAGTLSRLPIVFWNDLAETLKLQIAASQVDAGAPIGSHEPEELIVFINKVKSLLLGSADRPGWDEQARTDTSIILANALFVLGRYKVEPDHFRESVQWCEKALEALNKENAPHKWATAQVCMGLDLAMLGDRDRAKEATEQALKVYEQLAVDNPDVYLPDVAATLNNLGIHLAALGDKDRALKATEDALKIRQQLDDKYPDAYLPDMAINLNNLGIQLSYNDDKNGALKAFQKALATYQILDKQHPGIFLSDIATTLNNIGVSHAKLNNKDDAYSTTKKGLEIFQNLAKKHPVYLSNVAATLNNLGNRLSEMEYIDEALNVTQEALSHYLDLAVKNPNVYLPEVAKTLNNLGNRFYDKGNNSKSLDTTLDALKIYRKLVQKSEKTYLYELAINLYNVGISYDKLGEHTKAIDYFEESATIFEKINHSLPNLAQTLTYLLGQYEKTWNAQYYFGTAKRLCKVLEKLLAVQEKQQDPEIGNTRRRLEVINTILKEES